MAEHGYQNFTDDIEPSHGRIVEGVNAKVNLSDQGNSNRMDILYGGNGDFDGENHGHIVVIKDQIRHWRDKNGNWLIDDYTGKNLGD
jgi:hypothetical protein